MKLENTSYPNDLFMTSLMKAIENQISDEVDKAVKMASDELRDKIPEIIASLAVKARKCVKVDRCGPELVVVIKWDDEVEK